MIFGDTEIVEASGEHLQWMLQAMEMVCAHTYAGVHILICRRRKPLQLVRCLLAASLCAVVEQLPGPVIAPTNSETYYYMSFAGVFLSNAGF